ncbi:hypothetical protein D7Z54_34130 [Salibacterium salarium]|uniref:Uncharacterized protein n=1 Tax=Salibacterium salarium TaxID=284579 RepID=A0A3R9QEY7_9BACI|nr:hypothetical protein D7Z54_34130 [Salibacterium salarium]
MERIGVIVYQTFRGKHGDHIDIIYRVSSSGSFLHGQKYWGGLVFVNRKGLFHHGKRLYLEKCLEKDTKLENSYALL